MSTSATPAGRQRLVAAIGILLILALAAMILPLRGARERTVTYGIGLSPEAAASREASRAARVRQLFIEIKGRDPAGSDQASVDRWARSRLGIREVEARLRAERPLVGAYYFTWYRESNGEWRNDATTVPPRTPMPALGWYNSDDPDVMDAHIAQMTGAGFDFVIMNVIAELPESWTVTTQFFNRLRGERLKAAIMLDGLYDTPAAEIVPWIERAAAEFGAHPNYFARHGAPLVALFAARAHVDLPGVAVRNVYWTPRYGPGENTFHPGFVLRPNDWPFWSPTPQPVINGVVPVIPGYADTHLERERQMEYPRRDGETYHAQWQRALALRPELILVYSWNEHFEQTAIEPTDAWGDRYVRWTACYAAHARRGTTGTSCVAQ